LIRVASVIAQTALEVGGEVTRQVIVSGHVNDWTGVAIAGGTAALGAICDLAETAKKANQAAAKLVKIEKGIDDAVEISVKSEKFLDKAVDAVKSAKKAAGNAIESTIGGGKAAARGLESYSKRIAQRALITLDAVDDAADIAKEVDRIGEIAKTAKK